MLLPLRALLLLLLPLRALLLLLAEGRVRTLALDRTELVGIGLATTMASLTLLPLQDDGLAHICECDSLDRSLGARRLQTSDVDLNGRVHRCRKLSHEDHPLDMLRNGELVCFKALEVRLKLVKSRDRVAVSRDGESKHSMEVLIDDGHTWLAIGVLELIPDVFG